MATPQKLTAPQQLELANHSDFKVLKMTTWFEDTADGFTSASSVSALVPHLAATGTLGARY